MASPSLSPFSPESENEAKNHPYQFNALPGPKGSFEARQVKGGLYVRVDMPGVPPENLKINKYSDTRTVTFSGKAPIIWGGNMDTSERVYGGYVVLDRDPLELDVKAELKRGCLRMFFPNAEGFLHSLKSKKPKQPVPYEDPAERARRAASYGIIDEYTLLNTDAPNKETRDAIETILELYRKEDAPYQPPRPDQVQGAYGGNFVHINPYLLSGVEGVYEHKLVKGDAYNDTVFYVRLDMPGIDPRHYHVEVAAHGSDLVFRGESGKESHHDEGGRSYVSMMCLRCHCCRYFKIKDQLKDGVLRILCQKVRVHPSAKK